MYVLYDSSSSWEFDYITRDIIPPDLSATIVPLSPFEIANMLSAPTSAVASYINSCILVFSSNSLPYHTIVPVILYLKPRAVIHLSDEWGKTPEFSDIALCTPLYIRQYSHAGYEHAIQMPLGYMQGMLGTDTSLTVATPPRANERRYEWAFVGAIKHDRAHMVGTFKRFLGTEKGIHTNGLTAPEMYSVYKNAVFVLSGRGNVTLDCFRIYEAIIAGAIPVIVGSEDELAVTFRYNGIRPPCVYATSWESAATTCTALLACPQELQHMQDSLSEWWKSQIRYLREKILAIQ